VEAILTVGVADLRDKTEQLAEWACLLQVTWPDWWRMTLYTEVAPTGPHDLSQTKGFITSGSTTASQSHYGMLCTGYWSGNAWSL